MTYADIRGWFSPEDVAVYRELFEKLPDGGTLAELGVCCGRSIASVADIVKRKNLKVFSIDTFEGTEGEEAAHADAKTTDWEAIFRANIEAFGISEQVTVLRGRTDEMYKQLGDKSLDLVFIDAAHDADSVAGDIKNWVPKLKEAGILSGHDTQWPSVREGYGRTGLVPVTDGNMWFLLPSTHSEKPLFTICLIARNEAKTLPRALASLKEFRDRGGSIVVVDTGSTDDTAKIAREAGCIVEEVGDRFRITISQEIADAANAKIIDGEEPVLKAGETLFDFASARNYSASLAPCDLISMLDADEVFTKLDIDELNKLIQQGWEGFEYHFVFNHFPDGSPNISFTQSKMYNRKKEAWWGVVHEVLGNIQ